MRVAAIILAILLIAACPPRRARVVYVVPPGPAPAPVVPVMLPPTPPGPILSAKAGDPVLDHHLAEWEKRADSIRNLRAEISLKRTDAVFHKEREYTGVVLCMKPNFAVLRLDYTGDPTKTNYEAYICDGKAVYAYSGTDKTITEVPLPPKRPQEQDQGEDNLALGSFLRFRAADIKERFDITLFKTSEHYIYLDIKPLRPEDQREFQSIRLALYAPGEATAKIAYLPAQAYVLKPNGDTETWKFTNPKINIPGVEEKNFMYVPINGWTLQKAGQREGGKQPRPDKP